MDKKISFIGLGAMGGPMATNIIKKGIELFVYDIDENCVNFIRNAAQKYNYSYKEIVSGAGHDACAINTKIPAAMIMCPCVDGISHNEAEEIKKEWALTSTNVLMHAALEAAQ